MIINFIDNFEKKVEHLSFLNKALIFSFLFTFTYHINAYFKTPAVEDFLHYASLLNNFSNAMWSGDFCPKWLPNQNATLGSPVGIFYAPLLFYFTSLLQIIAPIDPHGFLRLTLAINISLFIAAIGAKSWLLEEEFKKKSG